MLGLNSVTEPRPPPPQLSLLILMEQESSQCTLGEEVLVGTSQTPLAESELSLTYNFICPVKRGG